MLNPLPHLRRLWKRQLRIPPPFCPHCRSIGSAQHVKDGLFICEICMATITGEIA